MSGDHDTAEREGRTDRRRAHRCPLPALDGPQSRTPRTHPARGRPAFEQSLEIDTSISPCDADRVRRQLPALLDLPYTKGTKAPQL